MSEPASQEDRDLLQAALKHAARFGVPATRRALAACSDLLVVGNALRAALEAALRGRR